MAQRLLIATRNPGKAREIANALQGLGLTLVSLDEVGLQGEPPESGDSYLVNALSKARWAAQVSGMPALGDDSGLEIEALGGFPGPHSSRFLGTGKTEEERNREILLRMARVPPEARGARYRCLLALVSSPGEDYLAQGVCEGAIASEPRGSEGFGYDPIFLLPEFDKTMGELTLVEKQRISHRGKALSTMRLLLERLIA